MKGKAWRQRSVIGAIVLNVAVIHAAGLVLLNQPQVDTPFGTASGSGNGAHPAAVRMRLVQATSVAMPAQARQTPSPSADTEPSIVPESEAPAPVAPTPPEPLPPPSSKPLPVDDVLAGVDNDAPSDQPAAGSEYIPRPQLSIAPRPSEAVIIPFPKEITRPGRYTAVLALFIDENGVVRRVRVDSPSLPDALENAARETFLQVHFSPGEVNGRQVKSLIRIEVVFENSRTAPPAERRSL
jgi:TonB family protein